MSRSFEVHADLAEAIERLARERGTSPELVAGVAACLLTYIFQPREDSARVFGVVPVAREQEPDSVSVHVVPLAALPGREVNRARAAGSISTISTSFNDGPPDTPTHLRLV